MIYLDKQQDQIKLVDPGYVGIGLKMNTHIPIDRE